MMTQEDKIEMGVDLNNMISMCNKELNDLNELIKEKESNKQEMTFHKDKRERLIRLGNILAEAAYQIREYTIRY